MSSPGMENQQPEYKKSENIIYKIKKSPLLASGLGLLIVSIIMLIIFLSEDVSLGIFLSVLGAGVGAVMIVVSTDKKIR